MIALLVSEAHIVEAERDAGGGVDGRRVRLDHDIRLDLQCLLQRLERGCIPAQSMLDRADLPEVVEDVTHPEKEREERHVARRPPRHPGTQPDNDEEDDQARQTTKRGVHQVTEPEGPIPLQQLIPLGREIRVLFALLSEGFHPSDTFAATGAMAYPRPKFLIGRRADKGDLMVQVERPADVDHGDQAHGDPRPDVQEPNADVGGQHQPEHLRTFHAQQIHHLLCARTTALERSGRQELTLAQVLTT